MYTTPTPGAPGVVTRVICVTRKEAALLAAALGAGGTLLGIGLGALGAVVFSFITGPEPTTKLISLIGGAIVGGLIGLAYITSVLRAGACTCPGGVFGFCLTVLALRPFPGAIPVPLPPFILPAPAACATVMPAGCP